MSHGSLALRGGVIRFRRPSPALIIACLALFVSLGGAGYAVTMLPRDSVTTVQVKNQSLLFRDIKLGQVARAFKSSGRVLASAGETKPLVTLPPFTVWGECVSIGSGNMVATVYLSTSRSGSAYRLPGEGGWYDFSPTHPVSPVDLSNTVPSTAQRDFVVISPSGVVHHGQAASGVFVFGRDCEFDAVFWN